MLLIIVLSTNRNQGKVTELISKSKGKGRRTVHERRKRRHFGATESSRVKVIPVKEGLMDIKEPDQPGPPNHRLWSLTDIGWNLSSVSN